MNDGYNTQPLDSETIEDFLEKIFIPKEPYEFKEQALSQMPDRLRKHTGSVPSMLAMIFDYIANHMDPNDPEDQESMYAAFKFVEKFLKRKAKAGDYRFNCASDYNF
ncbi:hypothetical protein [Vibrio fluvialis]|uniref:hypothetical protein n=1 Tax=Vibrio fluvialis TaxID=676 RepID=UPI0028DDE61C|nr:hypothetical protein [Vibrio fluvialis]MDT8865845.1 hypothetical protein [Vibrio fluvialis]MDT8873613.1 hypothetical protein [Vibrio fluvialis]